jgi:hypothetical protein
MTSSSASLSEELSPLTSNFENQKPGYLNHITASFWKDIDTKLANQTFDLIPPKSKRMISWDHHYMALVEYGKEYGHCNIPARSVYDCNIPVEEGSETLFRYHGNLGKWLHDQRQVQKGNKGPPGIKPEREAKLQRLVDQGVMAMY